MSGEEALGPSGTDLELVIKNPARSAEEDFSLRASGDWTVQQLKKQIERAYHGNPNPELQTLIYCGKVLKDPTTKLSSVLGLGQEPDGEERQSTRTLHMVVKQLQPPPSGRSSNRPTGERSVPASASQTPSPADRGAGAIPAPSAQPPPLPVHEHGPPPPPPVGDPPGAAEPAAGGVSPSACAGLEAPSEGYYIMDPVMAAAYNAALAAIIGASSENGAQQHPQWRQPFPFRVAAPSAAFLAPMIPQVSASGEPFPPAPHHPFPCLPLGANCACLSNSALRLLRASANFGKFRIPSPPSSSL
uniref:Ubiquitin-like domain-containing protein n=1 Tax=Tetraselmis sp. GSL018 TaxID=582737 RepID=A0A061S9A7_9CHLO